MHLDDLDLDLVSALQYCPRAEVRKLAEVLGVAASTITRRLSRMTSERLLRVVSEVDWFAVGEMHPQHVWVTAQPGCAATIAAAIAEFPETQFASIVTGETDVYAIIQPGEKAVIEELLTERLPAIGGVRHTRSDLAVQSFASGSMWRLQRMTSEQIKKLGGDQVADFATTRRRELSAFERQVIRALRLDGRASSNQIARSTGLSASSAYRTVTSLLEDNVIRPRVEIDPSLLGYPLEVVLALGITPAAVPEVGKILGRHSSARQVTMVAGKFSLLYQGVFADESRLATFLQEDLGSLSHVKTLETSVMLRVLRRYWIRHERNHQQNWEGLDPGTDV